MLRECLAAVVVVLSLSGCENEQDDKIFSAQKCLDTATSTTVDTCVAMIAGITTNQAYVIRCSAAFLAENIGTAAIVTAIDSIDNTADAKNSTAALYQAFAFSDLAAASNAVAACQATGSENLSVLALTAQAATVVRDLAGGMTIDAWLNSNPDMSAEVAADPAKAEELGEAVIAMHPIACTKGGNFYGTDVCTSLDAAIAGIAVSDPNRNAKVAEAFLNAI